VANIARLNIQGDVKREVESSGEGKEAELGGERRDVIKKVKMKEKRRKKEIN
jgi:hypothetical protein